MMEEPNTDEHGRSVKRCYLHAWETLKAIPGRLFLLLALFGLLQLPGSIDLGESGNLLSGLYQLLVVGPLTFGLSYTFLVASRGRTPEVSDLFAPFQRAYVSSVACAFLLPIVVFISALPMLGALAIAFLQDEPSPLFLLLGVVLIALPIFAAVRLSFVAYLIVEDELGPVEVLGESWARTEAAQLRILGVELVSVPLLLFGLLLFLVGVIPAMILGGLALATLYDGECPEPHDAQELDGDQAESGTQTPWNP